MDLAVRTGKKTSRGASIVALGGIWPADASILRPRRCVRRERSVIVHSRRVNALDQTSWADSCAANVNP